MPTWVFLRHGQSQANAERWLSGAVDTPLTSLGIEQARGAAKDCLAWDFERAFSSDLVRALRTARIVLEGRDVSLTVSEELQERSMGDWAHRSLDDVRESGESHLLIDWYKAPPNGESNASLARRSLSYLASVGEVRGPTLVVAHGGLIRVILGLIDGMDYEQIGRVSIANCHAIFRELPEGGFSDLLDKHRPFLDKAGRLS